MSKVNMAEVCIDRTLMATGLDDAIWTLHWVNNLGTSDVDHTARVTASTKIKTFWQSGLGTTVGAHMVLREVKWYDVPDAAPHKPVFLESILPAALPGTPGGGSSADMPPQIAITVTLKTSSRKHWGRFYIPGIQTPAIDSTHYGAIKQTTCDSICAAAKTMISNTTADVNVCVWKPTLGTWEIPDHVQVDDVFDVIRSRRMKHATYKAALAT